MSDALGRIDFAAVFSNPQCTVTILKMDRGPESLLRILTDFPGYKPEPYGSPLAVWAHGGWANGEYVAGVLPRHVHLNEACSCLSRIETTAQTATFCEQCGTPPVPGGQFCGGCGAAFPEPVPAEALRESLTSDAPTGVLRLMQTYALRDLDEAAKTTLVLKLPDVLHGLQLTRFIDGRESTITDRLTLARAQDVASKVARRQVLDARDRADIRRLLTRAPIQFGYWGPLKSVLKHLDPSEAPREFGTALGRLTIARPAQIVAAPADCEDLSPLALLFDLPQGRTLAYMRRRMRRALVSLAGSNPSAYLDVSAAALLAADRPLLEGGDFIPAFILLGSEPYLTPNSRSVRLPADQSEPRFAHPDLWGQRPDLARHIADSVQHSPHAFTFAVQVLRSAGEAQPAMNDRTVPLALNSTDPQVRQLGYGLLAQIPGCWPQLNSAVWSSVLREAADADVAATVDGLLRVERLPDAQEAVFALLLDETVAAGVRRTAAARIYLAFSVSSTGWRHWPWSPEVDAVAVIAVARTHGFDRTADVWRSVLEPLTSEGLLTALIALSEDSGITPATRDLIADVIAFQATADSWGPAARCCLAVESGAVDGLAWRLLEAAPDRAAGLAQLWEWVRTAPVTADRRARIASELLSRMDQDAAGGCILLLATGGGWDLPREAVAQLLAGDIAAAALLWGALAGPDPEAIEALVMSTPALLTAVGDHVNPIGAPRWTPTQHRVLLAYVTASPGRVAVDRDFGIAVACTPAPELQRVAVDHLKHAGVMSVVWLPLAESGLPVPLAAARDHLVSLTDLSRATHGVLAAIDSMVPVVRDLGLTLLDERREVLDQELIWGALLESDDRVVQARVAEEALVASWPSSADLGAFDRRILVTRRRNRGAKEQVKQRMEAMLQVDLAALVQPARLDALRNLVSGGTIRDREWALQRLAALTLAGVQVNGVAVRLTSGGDH